MKRYKIFGLFAAILGAGLFVFSACAGKTAEGTVIDYTVQIEELQGRIDKLEERVEKLEEKLKEPILQKKEMKGLKDTDFIVTGYVITSDAGIKRLSEEFPYSQNCTYPDFETILTENKEQNFFENYSFLLINFQHSSSETNIEYTYSYVRDGTLFLGFNVESPELRDTDVVSKPFVFKMKKGIDATKFQFEVKNLLPDSHEGGGCGAQNGDLIFY